MASGSTHLERTSGSSRRETQSDATVQEIADISPTVKRLVLHVQDDNFTFSPGQWVDFFAPGVTRVGGFSMCSSPHKLKSLRLLDLAVKYSQQEPAFWVHTKCVPGSQVQLRVGGDFHYDITPQQSHNLLLIAGGVGINPLMSVLYTVSALETSGNTGQTESRVVLLYSAKSQEELIFKDEIEAICREHSRCTYQFHLTGCDQSCPEETNGAKYPVINGRINSEVLEDVLKTHFPCTENLKCFLCGPGQMIDDMEACLMQFGLSKEQVHFEKWW